MPKEARLYRVVRTVQEGKVPFFPMHVYFSRDPPSIYCIKPNNQETVVVLSPLTGSSFTKLTRIPSCPGPHHVGVGPTHTVLSILQVRLLAARPLALRREAEIVD
ncbi:hypothetical protein RRG08_023489 [Elysia crispata]|uniref:Uncharacterized protein n=1 Tax=Elysia crispata TaxID=231223 RepID=A0AAE0YZH7_9GAST|nr:hypothetical protein RRG08_023489 [Elysia crispata]